MLRRRKRGGCSMAKFACGSPSSLSDLGCSYCAGGKSGAFFPDFSLHGTTMRLEIMKNCPCSPARLATGTQVRQAAREGIGQAVQPALYRENPSRSLWAPNDCPLREAHDNVVENVARAKLVCLDSGIYRRGSAIRARRYALLWTKNSTKGASNVWCRGCCSGSVTVPFAWPGVGPGPCGSMWQQSCQRSGPFRRSGRARVFWPGCRSHFNNEGGCRA